MPMRLLHVGTGVRGRQWLEVVRDYPDARSVALINPDARALAEAQRIIGTDAPVFGDLEEALGRVAADAALIASPSVAHADQAVRCLEAGLHVMVEKPLSMTVSDGLRVIEAADRAGRHAMVAENFRFFQTERTVRRWIDEGRLGAIHTVSCVDRRRQPPEELGRFAASLPAPQLVEIAVHHFDSFRYLFGRRPVSVSARVFNPPGSPYDQGAGTAAVLEMEHGLVIQYLGALTSHRHEYELWIDGEHGSLWTDRKRVWWRKRGGRFFLPVRLATVPKGDARPYPWAGTTALLDNLRAAVQHGCPPETAASDGIWTIAMIEAASRAHQNDRRVPIAELLDGAQLAHARRTALRSPRNEAPRLIVIGLDSADADLIDRWCAEGYLPTLQSLRAHGVWGRLGTTADRLHVSAWASFYTGTTPDKHGLYHAYVMAPGTQSPQRARADANPEPVFWKLLSDAGKRCIVMDAFMNCPLEPFHGVQILEYGTWSAFWDPMTVPRELDTEIRARFGPYPAEDQSQVLTPPDCAGFRDRLVRAAAKKAEIATWVMRRQPWDFFFMTFGEPHGAGHYLWHLHDPAYPAHPAHPAGCPPSLRSALRDVYVAIDRAIGNILVGVDPNTSVLVVAVDGMGPNYSGSHLLEPLLDRTGLMRTEPADDAPVGAEHGASSPLRRDLLKRLRDFVPLPLRAAISTRLPHRLQQRLSLRWMTAHLDWSRTRAFVISNANEGFIRVNLKGREPLGIVAPGADYDRLCDSLVTALRGAVNPRNGRAAAQNVWRADRIYSGSCLARLPDVVINWEPSAQLTDELASAEHGVVVTGKSPYELPPFYVGNHRPAAFVIARGSGVSAGKVLEGAHILDLAPTVLTHFGLDGTPSMTGKALHALLPVAGH